MRAEVKTAIIMSAIVAIAIGGLVVYFNSLDKPKESTQSQVIQTTPAQNQTSANVPVTTQNAIIPPIDESQFQKAPDLFGIAGYINTTPDDLKNAMKNKVVLYDFWTYSCINCIRTLPYVNAWYDKYSDKGLLIIGVHSPEFEFEKDINNVKMAVQKYGIKYPVVLDSDMQTWRAFGNQYWPRDYIADYQGYIRHDHIGEGDYAATEKIIQDLLQERSQHLGLNVNASQPLVGLQEQQFSVSQTPELYFGYQYAQGRNYLGNSEGFQPDKTVTYSLPSQLNRDYYYLEGQWQNLRDNMQLVSDSGKIVLPYFAKSVNIVAANKADLQILLDGQPVSAQNSGSDVQNGTVHVNEDRLYSIITTSAAEAHTVTIIAKPGFSIYTFTFG